jgi:cytochrome oxidase assembly protein ShyY1
MTKQSVQVYEGIRILFRSVHRKRCGDGFPAKIYGELLEGKVYKLSPSGDYARIELQNERSEYYMKWFALAEIEILEESD